MKSDAAQVSSGLLQPDSKAALLVVEDNADDAVLMTRAIRKAGLDNPVRFVTDGQQAWDYLSGSVPYADRSAYPFPSIVFLDLKLPKIHGLEVLRMIRESEATRHLIVIVLSSSNISSDMTRAYSLGGNSYVVKPPTFDELVEFVTVFKLYWLGFNSMPG